MKPMRFKRWLEWATVVDGAINRDQRLRLFNPKRLSTVKADNNQTGTQQEDPDRPDYLGKKKRQRDDVDRLFGF